MRRTPLLLAALLSLAPLGLTAPALADFGTATVQGTVTDAVTGAPLPGVTVQLVLDGSSTFETTDAAGRYTSTGRDAGSYVIGFVDNAGQHRTEWNADKPDKASADAVPVLDAASVTVDASLAPLPTLSGRVTDTAGQPVVGLCPAFVLGDPAQANSFGGSCTGADGRYSFGVVSPGDYRVRFQDGTGALATQWFAGATSAATATVLSVGTADVTGVDAVMQPASVLRVALRGTGGTYLRGCVTAFDLQGAYVASACTPYSPEEGPAGPVAIGGLAAGSYVLEGRSFDRAYVVRYFGGSSTAKKATAVRVGTGADVAVGDIVLPLGASITGTIVDAVTSAPVPYACAAVRTVDPRTGPGDGEPGIGCTDGSGRFTIPGLEAGSYPVEVFEQYTGSYATMFLPHAADSRTATAYKVKLGQALSVGTARLVQAGSAMLDVVDIHGAPVDFACALALSARTAEPIGYVGCTYGADPLTLTGLPTGDVLLLAFTVPAGSQATYLPSAATIRGAEPVHVTEGQTRTGLRLVLRAG